MKSKCIAGSWIFLAFVIVSSAHAFAASLPDLGRPKCYDESGAEVFCGARYGSDAVFNLDPRSYSKLDSNGNILPNSATSWAMVKDNVTGLIWELKTDMDGVMNYRNPHDVDNKYTWYDSNPATNGGHAGKEGNKNETTESFLKALNDARFGGFTDWRLPTIKELVNIIDYRIAYPGPTINFRYFPNTQRSWYWTSTTNENNPHSAWIAHFHGIFDYYFYGKFYHGYVRAVRGGS